MSTTRTALISGAGIAGPAVAFWLAEAGWDVTVVERAERLRTGGYPVDIRGTAREVIDRMGLTDKIDAHRHRNPAIEFLSPGGRRIARMDPNEVLSDPKSGDVEIARGTLTGVLYDATRHRADYVFGDTITDLSPTDTGVEVTFKHRATQRFDVVIGADGIHSKVRALAFGDEGQFLHHLGAYVAIWDIRGEMFAPGTGYMYSHPGRSAALMRSFDGSETRAFLTYVHPRPGSVNRHDISAITAELEREFAADRWRTEEIIATLRDADDVFFDSVSQVRMPRWSKGRVTLVGDAAYAPAFLSGQGTSLALAGAYVLAGELARHDDPAAGFAEYERRVREFVTRNQRLAVRTDSTVLSRTRGQLLRRNIRLMAWPVLQRLGLDRLLRRERRDATTDLALTEHDLRRSLADVRETP
ncbi:monooxygenase FAD-binding protein [Mycolicibacterium phlei]|uniref:Oxidoreductase n=1 Tax=Mycolicibacterium phlei DSM 43239 = CCUG 21000 TaxID=1226750 RepID=A0A5N5UY96_MYCPH|nr:FAD-dependent monooxygenase [Mycolicibacterium phlei]VEG09593.1 monooxygenase FAD-binding protein [Mycobacteroides chelonae]AMO61481.1 FAD-dependent urate hydroxylase [Mycolicibacterium phlei]EID12041.1 oxidoreductase [Mycolicibacterium phlei RIVM601174]KAB7754368.1 oxidoreductase [Mycolicibacterium phlei DSM 43239 = CCUG 21000]KXW63962.1 oxidoreductase [Mycolicibacterium phlei DSM 43239 = CCUG 21000]